MMAILKKQQVTNGLPSLLPLPDGDTGERKKPDWEMACKSGWDAGRQHDVGVLFVQGRRISMAALSKDVEAMAALGTLGLLGREVYDYAKRRDA